MAKRVTSNSKGAASKNAARSTPAKDKESKEQSESAAKPEAKPKSPSSLKLAKGEFAFTSKVANMRMRGGVQFTRGLFRTKKQDQAELIRSSGEFGKRVFELKPDDASAA